MNCRYASLLTILATIDEVELPDLPACDAPAEFSTVVARQHRSGSDIIRSRTCREHDAAFRIDRGYRDSIRLVT